eukprot:GILK01011120.1.p1 GENE.GILK01011120.1~~GILK01011120.1.p1  ORF type:complete len:1104 (+),score=179.34 GILK01011120.1:3-3314(+)
MSFYSTPSPESPSSGFHANSGFRTRSPVSPSDSSPSRLYQVDELGANLNASSKSLSRLQQEVQTLYDRVGPASLSIADLQQEALKAVHTPLQEDRHRQGDLFPSSVTSYIRNHNTAAFSDLRVPFNARDSVSSSSISDQLRTQTYTQTPGYLPRKPSPHRSARRSPNRGRGVQVRDPTRQDTTTTTTTTSNQKLYTSKSPGPGTRRMKDTTTTTTNTTTTAIPAGSYISMTPRSRASASLSAAYEHSNLPSTIPQTSSKILQRVFSEFSVTTHPVATSDPTSNGLDASATVVSALSLNPSTPMKPFEYVNDTVEEMFKTVSHEDEDSKEHLLSSPVGMSVEQKVDRYMQCLQQHNRQVSLGGLVGIQRHLSELSFESRQQIVHEIANKLIGWSSQEDTFVLLALETLSLTGSQAVSALPEVLRIVGDLTRPVCQEAALRTAVTCGPTGVQALLELSAEARTDLDMFILTRLAQVPFLQSTVLVPALLQEAVHPELSRRLAAVAVLNRLYDRLGASTTALPILKDLLIQGGVDRDLAASTVRVCGSAGEQVLLDLLKRDPNGRVRAASAQALSWRVPLYPKHIEVKVHKDTLVSRSWTAGLIFHYAGSLLPTSMIPPPSVTSTPEHVLIYAREFAAGLHRVLTDPNLSMLESSYPVPPWSTFSYTASLRQRDVKASNLSKHIRFDDSADEYMRIDSALNHDQGGSYSLDSSSSSVPFTGQATLEHGASSISEVVVSALVYSTQDSEPLVRLASVESLGTIGLPEAFNCVSVLIAAAQDNNAKVRAAAAWSLGKLGAAVATDAVKTLLKMLRDEFWKVRYSACIALGQLGPSVARNVVPVLAKILKEGTINRNAVADTLVRLGTEGEAVLVELLRNESITNTLMRASVVQSLAAANIASPFIDHVVEAIFGAANDRMPTVRKTSVAVATSLGRRAKEKVPYLKVRHLLPFLYQFLKDKDVAVREVAAESIASFGSQGELILIEGLTKDVNPTIRLTSALGLQFIGPRAFRTLLLALHDGDHLVRRTAAEVIVSFGSRAICDVLREREFKHSNESILYAIRETLSLPWPIARPLKDTLTQVLHILEQSHSELNRLNTDTDLDESSL